MSGAGVADTEQVDAQVMPAIWIALRGSADVDCCLPLPNLKSVRVKEQVGFCWSSLAIGVLEERMAQERIARTCASERMCRASTGDWANST